MNYGYQETVTLMNLQDAGLFKIKDKKAPGYIDWNWFKIKQDLKLVDDNCNLKQPDNVSYVHNGLAPISVKLIEKILETKGLSSLLPILKMIGQTEDKLSIPKAEQMQSLFASGGVPRAPLKKKKILVYFLGGITYAEISALRFLKNQFPTFNIIIGTTCILGGKKTLCELMGPSESNLLVGDIIKGK